MSRRSLIVVVLALAVVSTPAVAYVPCAPQPIFVCPPPPCAVPCPPGPAAAPKVHETPGGKAPEAMPGPKASTRTEPLRPPTVVVEPAGYAAPEPAKPEPKPEVKIELPTPVPETPKAFELPAPRPVAQDQPSIPTIRPELPPSALPKPDAPKPIVPELPPAIPMLEVPKSPEAPAKLPAFAPKPPDGDSNLPALKLPTLPSVSQSSPLTGGERRVEILPAEGRPALDPAKRWVRFYNNTDRDVKLTVMGESITLPARHQIPAEVPATFQWQLDNGDPRSTAVPVGATGVEIVIRK